MSGWGWRKEIPIGPPDGVALVDAIANALEPTELVRRRREFIAANPDDPLVKAYLEEKAKKDGNNNPTT
jgi:hypothetical protein